MKIRIRANSLKLSVLYCAASRHRCIVAVGQLTIVSFEEVCFLLKCPPGIRILCQIPSCDVLEGINVDSKGDSG